MIAWHINQILKDNKNINNLLIKTKDNVITFHVVVAAGTFAETSLEVSEAEISIRNLFPGDLIRFRTHDERGFNPDMYKECYEYESKETQSESL